MCNSGWKKSAATLGCAAAVLAAWSGYTANAQVWVGVTTDWNTAANWNPAQVPNSSIAAVVVPDSLNGQLNISSSVLAQSITFDLQNPGGAYLVSSNFGQTLSGITTITVTGASSDVQFGLASTTSVNLLFPTGNSLTFNNNTAASELVIASSTTIGTPGEGGVVFNGVGVTVMAGAFANSGGNEVDGGLAKNGAGTLLYSGSGASLAGVITVAGGILQFDYSSSSTAKTIAGDTLSLQGGQFLMSNPIAPIVQTFGTTSIGSAQTDVQASGTGAFTLGLGAIFRSGPGTADFSPAAGTLNFTISTTATNTNGILGSTAYATIGGGTTWATVSGGNIVGLLSYATTFASGNNTNVTASASLSGFLTNSVRFNTGSPTLTLSGTNTLQSGGILVSPSATGATITGGTLTATGGGELVVQQYSAGLLTINSSIVSSVGLTKSGPGTLILGGNNTSLTGPININRGSLDISNTAAVNSASQINFNDVRSQNDLQTFTVDLGNNNPGTVTPNITVSAFGGGISPQAGTFFSTGASDNSRVTLSGVIGSAPGQNTPIVFAGNTDNSSGFNLTNTNTFTGNVTLNQGYLGINSDANLGDPSNTLVLNVGGTVLTGGLVFLNSGINIQHPINVLLYTSVISNGTDNNTISGLISGTSNLTKDGTGTLTLTNPANTTSGGLIVFAGNLAVSADGNLGAPNSSLILDGGALETTASFTLSPQRPMDITFSTGTFNTDALSTLTVPQLITGFGAATLNKSGGGTLILSSPGTYALSLTVSAGTLVLNAATFTGTTFLNNSSIIGQAGFTGSAFTNNGQITVTGGPWNISGVTNVNAGNIYLAPALGLQLGGGTLTNSGAITLAGATISGSATLNNVAGGIISGPGLINVSLQNGAGATLSNSGPGALIIQSALSNAGLIELGALNASLNGGIIANSGTIQGLGLVNNSVNNSGTIEAVGGTLSFSGQVVNTGTIGASAGNKVLMLAANAFPTNAGLISLAGGTFDNGGQTLNNTGQITGYGVLSTGGLTNNGIFTLTGGTSTVNGNVTNSASQTINIQYQPAIFTGNINNLGTINVTQTTITYTGTYTGNKYNSDPATNIFQNSVTIIPGGSMTGGAGDQYEFTGGSVTNNGTFANGGLLQSSVNVANTGTFTQSGPQSWSAGTTFTNAAGTANFLSDAGSSNGLNLAISVLSGNVNFTGPEHLQGLSVTGGTAAFTGSALVSGRGNRNANAAVGVVDALTIAGGATPTGTVNLNNNALIISNGGAPGLNAVETDIAYARDGGKWDKPGITSSTAQSAYAATDFDSMTLGDALNSSLPTPYTTFGGQSVSPNDVLVAFTYGGDANLDGTINGNDYFQIDRGFLDHYTGWVNGDFNHDGVVNGNDYFIIDSNFIDQSGQLAAPEVLAHAAEFGPSYLSQFTPGQLAEIGVPEPASLALLGLGVIGLCARRRRPCVSTSGHGTL